LRVCRPDRSEGTLFVSLKILRYTQYDKDLLNESVRNREEISTHFASDPTV